MEKLPAILTLIFVPVYVLGAFVTYVFVPEYQYQGYEPNTVQLVFVGDMMFDRYIRSRALDHGYIGIFGDTVELFADADIVVGNLEGPITSNESVSDWLDSGPNHYTFTFATSVASSLHAVGFSAVTLANNHIMNFGELGYLETKQLLDTNNVAYFGGPGMVSTPWYTTVEGIVFAFYSYDTLYTRDIDVLTERISREPETTVVVVYAHWGDEYELEPNTGQLQYAHQLVDAGADLILGSHPHVVQSKEQYNGVWIYYSLGNFIFDQYFSKDVSCGAVVTVDVISAKSISVHESFISLERNGVTNTSNCMSIVPTHNQK